jgi:UDP-GlcNAc:undecaprenyl-phosphate GlcNAc-1-phosphate transferase
MNINYIVSILLLNLIFIFIYNKITKKFNLFDIPDFNRKLHRKKTSLIGGLLFFFCFLIYFLFEIFYSMEFFFTLKEIISLLIITSLFFLIGLYDDKYNLKPNSKLYLMFFFSLCLILFNNDFSIKELNFSFYSKSIQLGNFSVLFTVICFLCFVNACNMFDGIDLQFGFYLILLSIIFITKEIMINFHYALIICAIFFLFNNFRKKIFIGNNGTLFLGSLFSFFFIGTYNKTNLFFVDEIFLIMAIPGLDLIRVSILRLTKGKHMFQPDNLHIHHILFKKMNIFQTNFVIQLLIILPLFNFYMYKNFFISLIISIISYLSLIIYAKKIIK